MWYLRLQTFIMSLLEDESGANAVEYALIMALVVVFIIAAVILMATEIGNLFNAMAACLSDAVICSAGEVSPISSRNKVPPSACSKRPCLSRSAPVKAPRLYPKSSLSSSVSGSAPQFCATKRIALRGPV